MKRFWKPVAMFIGLALIFTTFTIIENNTSPQHLSPSTEQEISHYTSNIKPLVKQEENITVFWQHSNLDVEICYFTGPMQETSGVGIGVYILKNGSSSNSSPYVSARISAITLFYENYSENLSKTGNVMNNFTLSTADNNGISEIGTHSFFGNRILMTSYSTAMPDLGPSDVTMNGTITVTIVPEFVYGSYHISGTPVTISQSFRQVLEV